jgi:hypothetical protein
MRTFALRCKWRKDLCGVALLLLIAAWTLNARADDAPPQRAARLSYLQGNVTVDHMDNTAGDPAQINMPVLEGSRLTTGEDGQAEVEFEDGSVVRVTPNSSVGLNELSVDASGNFHTQLTVLHGLVYAELRAAAKFSYSVNADGEVISPVANASMRINLDEPPVTVSVLDGTVHIEHAISPETNGYKTDVHAGEALTGDASDGGRYFLLQSIEPESWDQWNQDRDQAAAEAAADRTTARDGYAGDQGYGWADLDANGSWYDVPGQGQVWQPAVAQDADFDPYGYGNWVAYPVTGYVWASGYAWGWTPFRCGSWSYWTSFGWGWSPGVGCGRAGWGFGGGFGHGVYVVNIGRPPLNYRLPKRPVHEAGMLHPIPVGRAPREPGTGLRPSHEPRLIAGVSVEPMRPAGSAVGNPSGPRSHSVVGAALRSDFAVDRTSRQPVLGVAGAAPTATPRGDFRSASPRPVVPSAAVHEGEQPARQMRADPPPQQRSSYPAQGQGEHPAQRPSAPAYTSPAYTPRPAPPPSSPPAPRTPPNTATPAPAAPKSSQQH